MPLKASLEKNITLTIDMMELEEVIEVQRKLASEKETGAMKL